jgi:hypothetical protein
MNEQRGDESRGEHSSVAAHLPQSGGGSRQRAVTPRRDLSAFPLAASRTGVSKECQFDRLLDELQPGFMPLDERGQGPTDVPACAATQPRSARSAVTIGKRVQTKGRTDHPDDGNGSENRFPHDDTYWFEADAKANHLPENVGSNRLI